MKPFQSRKQFFLTSEKGQATAEFIILAVVMSGLTFVLFALITAILKYKDFILNIFIFDL